MSIQEVTQKLVQLNELHCSLLELGERKKQVLIDNQVDELSRIVNQESRLLKNVSECERQWLESMTFFLREKGCKPHPSITVGELAKFVFNAEEKDALLGAQERLMETIRKLQGLNALNQQLIEQSLAFINYSLDLVTGSPDQDAVYRNPAHQTHSSKRTGFFDFKA